MNLRIRPLNQSHITSAIRIIKNNPKWYGKFDAKKDVNWMFASQMYEVNNDNNDFIAMFGLNRFDYFDAEENGFGEEIVLNCVWVRREYRKQGIFNKIVKFAIKEVKKERYDLNRPVHLTIAASPKNELAKSIYNRKFNFICYNKKQRMVWFEIVC